MNFIKRISISLVFATTRSTRQRRQLWWIAVCTLLAAAGLAQFNSHLAKMGKVEALHGEAAIRQLKSDGGHTSLAAAMTAARYQINAAPAQASQSGPLYYANNPGQQLRATFAADEVRLSATSNKTDGTPDDKIDSAELRLQLVGYGYGKQLELLAKGKLTAQGDRIEIKKSAIRNSQSAITEWYVNKPEGLEQGFTLSAPPTGERQGQWLRVSLSVGDGWRASLRGDGQGAAFERLADGLQLVYDHLLAYDAQGRALPALMQLADGALSLLVDDAQAAYPLTIDPIITQQRKLTAADGAAGDQFGGAVALSENTAVIGARSDDVAGVNQGSVYVFVRSGAIWTQQQKLTANDGLAGDEFGTAVAISGDTVVVGAPNDVTGANIDQGSVYIFTRNGTVWTQQQKLTANDGAADDEFGSSVAISGESVVVGAEGDTFGTSRNQGSAYVFTRSITASGALWTLQQKLSAGDDGAAGDRFGGSVAISGETVVAGARRDSIGANAFQGSAYVFTRSITASGGVWTQQQKLTANDGAAGDEFGSSVAVSGNTVVAGAPRDNTGVADDQGSAYAFTRSFTPNGGAWTQQLKITAADGAAGDQFGSSVSLSGDTVVVGAPGDKFDTNADQGSAYVFSRNGTVWAQQRKLSNDDGVAGDQLGISVALSGDTVVMGASGSDIGTNADQGSAYVFVICANNFVQQQSLLASDGAANDLFGISVALSGDTVVVGASGDDIGPNADQGSAYVFVRSSGGWTQQQRLTANDGAANDFFGRSVAISGDTVVVGAGGDDIGPNENQGSAYVFTRSGAVWTQQQKLIADDGAASDGFSVSVAVSGDTVAVGASDDGIGANPFQGSTYVFTRSGAIWTKQQKLIANDGTTSDQFGSSVALGGNTLVVGASNDHNGSSTKDGSAYVFTRSGTVWAQQQKLIASDDTAFRGFGFSTAISGDTVVVGVLDDNSYTLGSQGAAYVFTRSGTVWTQQQKLIANDGEFHNYFSTAVAISGDTVVVGAFFDTVEENTEQGSVYVFTRGGTTWTLQQILTAGDGAAGDFFGISVSVNGGNVVVGASFDDIGTNANQGSAYIFACPACPAVTLNPATLPTGAIGNSYNQTITASGGTGPVQFSLSDGALPPGLSLSPNGLLSGTPSAEGTYRFTITATISSSLCSGSRSYTLIVTGALCPTVVINPAGLPAGEIDAAYSQQLFASGGTAPYSFSSLTGGLPQGLTLTPGGLLSGFPAQPGTFNFTVQATDQNGCTGTRAYSVTINSGSANNGLLFFPLAHPVRLLDTRPGQSGCFTPGAPIAGGTSRTQFAQGGCDGLTIPASARAITGNITTVQSGGGFLTLYPSDAAQPLVANSNYAPNEIINNVFTVALGATGPDAGAFKIFAQNTTDVVVDVTGYYAPPAATNAGGLYFHPLPKPIRLLETRAGFTGCTTPGVPLPGNTNTSQLAHLTCDGVTIPNTARAIVGNATTVGPQGPGFLFLTLFPADAAKPLIASSNYLPGQVMNAPFTVGLSASGEFKISPTTQTDLVIDVLGYYSAEVNDANGAGLLFTPLSKPVRLLETRAGFAGCDTPNAALTGGSTRTQGSRGVCEGVTIAANARGIIGNATVVSPQNGGFLTFWPSDVSQPLVASSNFSAGQAFNRHFTVGLGNADGAFKIFTSTGTELVIDVSGFFAP